MINKLQTQYNYDLFKSNHRLQNMAVYELLHFMFTLLIKHFA